MSKLSKSIPYVAVALAVYAFYAFAYGATLQYGEQYQLFQSTTGYFLGLLARPGGLAMYVGRFLTQFFIIPLVGAIFISMLSTGIFACIAALSKSSRYRWQWALLITMLPVCALLDKQALLNSLVCILIGCVIVLLINKIKQEKIVATLLPFLTFITFWIAGGLPAAFVAGYVFCSCMVDRRSDKALLMSAIISMLVVVASPFVARQLFGVQLNATRTFLGADYSRYVVSLPKLAIAATILIAFLPLTDSLLNNNLPTAENRKIHRLFKPTLISWLIVVLTISTVSARMVDFDANRKCDIEFCARMKDWRRIIKIADQKQPTDVISMAYINLALAKTNSLGDKMFSYAQIGPSGLIPDFELYGDLSMALCEIYYHLGGINFSERFAYEAAKSNPDYQESARAVKRLAETSIIKENYPLARKYLAMLCNTTFYAKWARKSLMRIDSGRTNENAEWARERSIQITDDCYYTEKNKDILLYRLFATNPNNRLAFEYLMAYYLLNKDLEQFMQYANLGGRFYGAVYPRAFREAAVFHLRMKNPETVKDFGTADRQLLEQFYKFGAIYNPNHHDARLAERFGDTYWYYLFKE